jgi:hypothetical protein
MRIIGHYAYIAREKFESANRFLTLARETLEQLAEMPGLGWVWETKIAGWQAFGFIHCLDGSENIGFFTGRRSLASKFWPSCTAHRIWSPFSAPWRNRTHPIRHM